jgi:hypothetical protein
MKSFRFFIAAIALLTSSALFAHGGHKHSYLGTVKLLHENHLVVNLKDAGEKTFVLTKDSQLVKGDKGASREDLIAGARVSVYVQNDDSTVTTVKIAPPKK